MSSRDRPRDLGRARGLRMLQDFGREFREARRAAGLSQAAVAEATGIARSTISKLELGTLRDLSVVRATALGTAVRLDVVLRTYAGSRQVRDAGQIRLLRHLVARLGPGWEWRFEVPIGPAPDQRAWDAVGTHRITGERIVVEAISRLTDVQATLRRIERKRLDAGLPRLVIVLAETHANADALDAAAPMLQPMGRVPARTALRALTAGRDPGADVLLRL